MNWLLVPFLGAVILSVLWYWAELVPETTRQVVTRPYLNRILRVLKPGIHLVYRPFEIAIHRVECLPRRVDILLDRVRSRDGVPFKVRCTLIYQVNIDRLPRQELYNLLPFLTADPGIVVRLYAEDKLRARLGACLTTELIQSTDYAGLAALTFSDLVEHLAPNGLQVARLFLSEILPPLAVQQAMTTVQAQPFNSTAQVELLQAIRNCSTSWGQEERDFTIALQEAAALADDSVDTSRPLVWQYLFRHLNHR